MKIGIDARSIGSNATGFGTYTYNLLSELKKIDRKNQYSLFFCNAAETRLGFGKKIIVPSSHFPELWENTRLYWAAKKEKIELLHCTGYPVPIFGKFKKVFTIHDLSPMIVPQFFSGHRVTAYWQMALKLGAKAADAIITDSENSKKDIIKLLGVSGKKITVIPLAAGRQFKSLKKADRKKFEKRFVFAGNSFLLFVSTIQPRKNLDALLKAFALLKNKGRKEKLVVAGEKGWKTKSVFDLVKSLGLEKDVVFLGFVQEKKLVELYNFARVFIYPSFYEGFGLPPLEAMQCGCPVITSNNSSLPEVVGKAAILINPNDEKEIAMQIERVLTDNKLRGRMVSLGLKQAKKFSWKKTAEKTLQVYERVIAETK